MFALGLGIAALAWAAAGISVVAPPVSEVQEVMADLSRITGFPVRHELHFEVLSRAQVGQYIDSRARKTVKPKEAEAEQTALEMLGFIPRGYDLRKAELSLMTEQAAAFYDYHKRALVLADWTSSSMRDLAVVHELAHALADQSFHLGRYVDAAGDDSEKDAARDAVVEGQATYLMLAYEALGGGLGAALRARPDASEFDDTVAGDSADFPVFARAPLYLRASLVFPYTWGCAFQAAVVARYGQEGFREVFQIAPLNTRQIFHPETYFARETSPKVALPRNPRGYKSLVGGPVGELDHRTLIWQYASLQDAKRIAPNWRGGEFRVAEQKGGGRDVLLYASEWADEPAAQAFFTFYKRCLQKKYSGVAFEMLKPNVVAGRSDQGYFRVRMTGNRIESVEGMESPGQVLLGE